MRWFQEPHVGNKRWHMGAERRSKLLFFFLNIIFFFIFFGNRVSFLWYVKMGGIHSVWSLLRTCFSFTNLLPFLKKKKERIKGLEDKEEGDTRRRSVKCILEEKDGSEMALITPLHYRPTKRLYKTKTNGEHCGKKRKKTSTSSQVMGNTPNEARKPCKA